MSQAFEMAVNTGGSKNIHPWLSDLDDLTEELEQILYHLGAPTEDSIESMETDTKGGGITVSRRAALALLTLGMPVGLHLMSFEYGKNDYPESEQNDWTGVCQDDLETLVQFPKQYVTFEIWKENFDPIV